MFRFQYAFQRLPFALNLCVVEQEEFKTGISEHRDQSDKPLVELEPRSIASSPAALSGTYWAGRSGERMEIHSLMYYRRLSPLIAVCSTQRKVLNPW